MTFTNLEQHQLNHSQIWEGFKKLLPISLFVTVFGAAFGLTALQAGINDKSIIIMSALVFAGYAQFATLELWGAQVSIFALMITVFVINARHLLIGASLYPWLRKLPAVKRYGVMLVASDANWVMSIRALNHGQPGLGLLLGGGIALWSFWVLGTWLGVYFGNLVTSPARLGLDMVMGCFLLAITVDTDKNARILIIWLVAACSSLIAYWYLPDNSHVIAGALAGGFVGLLWVEKG